MEHRQTIPIRYSDIDMLGHLNQAVYHELLEDARGGLIADLLGPAMHNQWVLVHIELDYHREVRKADGAVVVVAGVEKVGTKSVTLRHALELPDGTVAASGRAVLVAWDGERRTSREFTPQERQALQAAA